MGFLIGDKSSVTTQTISDAEMEEERIDTTITINGTFPVGLPCTFCSPLGRINESALSKILGNCEKDVVGWYSFRRNWNHRPSLREVLLHRELTKTLTHMPSQYFIFCIVTTTTNERHATHTHKFTFLTSNHRRLQPISVIETNHGEPEDTSYRRSTIIDDSFKHLQQSVGTLNGTNDSEMAMAVLYEEVDKHVHILERNISKIQAEIDRMNSKINVSQIMCSEKEPQTSRRESSASTSSKVKVEHYPDN